MKTDAQSIIEKLRKLAPSVAFATSREIDNSFRWNGDGPDPRNEGFECYDVEVCARSILGGRDLEASDYLGGTYEKPGEFDADIGGYLPQMLAEAAGDLARRIAERAKCDANATRVLDELKAVDDYLSEVMRLRYDAQLAAS